MKRIRLLVLILILAALLPGALSARAQTAPIKGWLYIPAANLVRPIVDVGIVERRHDVSDLGQRVGHLEGTTWVTDDWGRVVLAGHSPGPFERLGELEAGDVIFVADWPLLARYVVTKTHIVNRYDIQWVMPTTEPTLVLITCSGERRLVAEAIRAR